MAGVKSKWRAFIGVSIISFIAFVDFTIVNTALPVIQKSIGATIVQLQWVMNIYFLVCAMFMVVAGKLGDLFGYRKILYIGSAIFAMASLAAGLSLNPLFLIVARFFQAIGGAIIFPVAASLLTNLFVEDEVPKVLGLWGAIGGAGLAIGPVLGGLLTSYISWRAIFFVNIPLYLIAMFICLSSVPKSLTQENIKIDWWGFVFFVLGIGGIVFGVINGGEYSWVNNLTMACLLIGILAMVLLFVIERRIKDPLLHFNLFGIPLFFAGALSCMLGGVASGLVLFFNPLYLHNIKNESIVVTGLILFVITLSLTIFSSFLGKIVKKVGLFGAMFIGGGAAILAAALQLFFHLSTPIIFIMVPMVFIGIAWAIANTVPTIAVHSAVAKDKIGMAIGMTYTMFNLGGSIGLAVAVVVFNAMEASWMKQALQTAGIHLSALQQHNVRISLADPDKARSLLQSFGADAQQMLIFFKNAFMQGFHGAIWCLFAIAVVTLAGILGAWIKHKKVKEI